MAQQNFRCAGCGMAVAQGKEPLANSSPVFESFFFIFFSRFVCTFVRSLRQTVSHDCDDFVHMQFIAPRVFLTETQTKIRRKLRGEWERKSYRQCKGFGVGGGGYTRARLLQAIQGKGVIGSLNNEISCISSTCFITGSLLFEAV